MDVDKVNWSPHTVLLFLFMFHWPFILV